MHPQENDFRRKALCLSLVIFLASLVLPFFLTKHTVAFEGRSTHLDSEIYTVLWLLFSFADGFGGKFTWFANPLFGFALFGIHRRKSAVTISAGVVALGLGCTARDYFGEVWTLGPGGATDRIVGLGLGYYVWMAALASPLLPTLLARRSVFGPRLLQLIAPLLALFLVVETLATSEEEQCRAKCAALSGQHIDHYEVGDGRFFASAEVMPNENSYLGPPVIGQRTLELNFFLRDKSSRSSAIRGKDEFKKIIQHFDGRFDQIMGSWVRVGAPDELSDNLDGLNSLTGGANPVPIEEAVLQTWTGKQASAAGYTVARVVNAEGSPGAYTSVKVIFRKP